MKKIFVSYTTKDKNINQDSLKKIYNKLKCYGEVFIDVLSENSINTQKDIFDKLCMCDTLLVLRAESEIRSKWVSSEISIAKILNKKIVYIDSSKIIKSKLEDLFLDI